MRRPLALAVLIAAALAPGAALACTILTPLAPLVAVPRGTTRTMAVLVRRVSSKDQPRARLVVLRAYRGSVRPGSPLSLPYLPSPCGNVREPHDGARLIVYASANRALGWATIAEARRFDPLVR